MIVSLLEKFEQKISAIEESCDLKTLTVYELISKLQAHEQRTAFRMEDMAAHESAFQALPKWKPLAPFFEKKQQYGRADKGKMVATQSQPSKKDKFPPCPILRIKVKLGNGSIVQSEGKGIVAVQTKKGTKYIHDVLYIPSLSQNLLSVAQMLRKGYSVSFVNNACYIHDSCGVELARIKMVENSFPITWNSPCLHAVYVSKSDETYLWHKRYGHFNLKSLKFLQTNELVRDLPEIHVNDDAVYTAIYLLNGLPTKAVQGKTPIEAWYGVKPSAHHLKNFCSICYTHVPYAKRTRLDVKAKTDILVGYSTKSKGYRVYNLESEKISVHKDVQVDEDSYWDWDKRAVVKNEPNTYAEASKHDIWRHTMQEEIQMIEKNDTWELTSLPPKKNAVGVKWVFRTKMNPNGSIHKHKARLVVKGYAQQAEIDYGDTFAPVARHDTVRMKTFMCNNLKALLFLVMKTKFTSLKRLCMGSSRLLDPSTAGLIHFSFSKGFKGVKMSQPCMLNATQKFSMDQCKSVPTPLVQNSKLIAEDGCEKTNAFIYRSLVRSLLYLIATRPDLMYAASLLSRFMHSPSQAHFGAAKRVGNHEDAKSTTGFVFIFGYVAFSWMSRKQELKPCVIHCDNNFAIAIAHNPVQYGRTKHINVKFHVLRNMVQSIEIEMVYCDRNEHVADIFTKALSKFKFEKFKTKLGASSKNSGGVLKT
ncbi:hypothetical protein SLEP1_g48880 [Rubroshorea leprosula]|uniref:Polyprotein n=1 Tax=Rubroshorea leprosula TaxID=152421 RepID=A0AAV5LX00_9ROSI|nr:hypothetical protein SLEP1_g48880 [Rubroshorea leprosula]